MDPHQSMASIAPVSAVSEKVLKGQAVSHSVRLGPISTISLHQHANGVDSRSHSGLVPLRIGMPRPLTRLKHPLPRTNSSTARKVWA